MTKPGKIRLDQLMLDRGLAESRSKAQALILAGLVYAGEKRLDKPGSTVASDIELDVRGREHPWVSRGGVKLAHGLKAFDLDPKGRIALDIGASTGGFTDVLLSQGAAKVYAVDVGHGQLDWKLRNDPRVVVLEKFNARNLTAEQVPEPVGAIVCDASFIGLETVLQAPMKLAAPGAFLVALIKPQFEVGRARVGKGGIVRDPELHKEVCDRMERWLGSQFGWTVKGICPSPIEGADGNREFLICGLKDDK